jgi:hypothetical protein
MSALTVVGWTSWDSDDVSINTPEHEKAVFDYLVEHELCFAGDLHQSSDFGVPMLSDGTRFQCSMRYWGGLMSDVFNEIGNKYEYDYMDFYMQSGIARTPKLPEGEINGSK